MLQLNMEGSVSWLMSSVLAAILILGPSALIAQKDMVIIV